eukprot:gene4093-4773_t
MIVFAKWLFRGFQAYTRYGYEKKKLPVDYECIANKTCIVTGANSGIGYATALDLAREEAIAKLFEATNSNTIYLHVYDLSLKSQVHSFVKEFVEAGEQLDVLVLNAGVMRDHRLILCPIWFAANYTYNLSLDITSVSSNTILSALSGVFSLFITVVMGIERFTLEKFIATLISLPSARVFLYLMFNGVFGSFLSDLIESYSVVMTSPVINTVGLSLSIPLAMISDFVRKRELFGWMYIMGSVLVIAGFFLANLASSLFEDRLKRIESSVVTQFKRIVKKES